MPFNTIFHSKGTRKAIHSQPPITFSNLSKNTIFDYTAIKSSDTLISFQRLHRLFPYLYSPFFYRHQRARSLGFDLPTPTVQSLSSVKQVFLQYNSIQIYSPRINHKDDQEVIPSQPSSLYFIIYYC